MKQYCRYCIHLFVGDVIYCGEKEKIVAESTAKTTNKCKQFSFTPEDAFMETEGYKERVQKTKPVSQNLCLWGE